MVILRSSIFLLLTVCLQAQFIGMGPSRNAGIGIGIPNFFNWYNATPTGGCVDGPNGTCVGHNPQGDTYYWSAWLPNASGLPKPSGLPIVGTGNDSDVVGCAGHRDIIILQLDVWSWASPTASHINVVNCMASFSDDTVTAWHQHLTSLTSTGGGSWKSRTLFSKGGIIYLPVERQITSGTASIHDATFIMSPDSGAHWCNPYTLYNVGTNPGICNASKWQTDGDAPKCGSANISSPCLAADYTDATHSDMMFHAIPTTTDNWVWVNTLNQDGATLPSSAGDGCDPATYTCFMGSDGSIARTTNVMDISTWSYYTCPTMTQSYRCSGLDSASWTTTYANRSIIIFTQQGGAQFMTTFPVGVSPAYVKEFKAYVLCGVTIYGGNTNSVACQTSQAIQGPWTQFSQDTQEPWNGGLVTGFLYPAPALGYVVSGNSVQLTWSSNSYLSVEGSPQMHSREFVLGKNMGGEGFQGGNDLPRYISGVDYQFSDGHMTGSFPRNGLVEAYDFLDAGINYAGPVDYNTGTVSVVNGSASIVGSGTTWTGGFSWDTITINGVDYPFLQTGATTATLGFSVPYGGVTASGLSYTLTRSQWPYWIDRASGSSVIVPCQGITYGDLVNITGCTAGLNGAMMFDKYGIRPYALAFKTAPSSTSGDAGLNAPSTMQGNGSYSVATVVRLERSTGNCGGIWATGATSVGSNTEIILCDISGTLQLTWNNNFVPRSRYISNFTFPNFGNWYYIVATVQATTGACGANCVPVAHLWVGGAVTPGKLTDTIAGVAWTDAGTVTTHTPNIAASPIVLGMGGTTGSDPAYVTYSSLMVYSRPLTFAEVQMMYQSMKAKMLQRGITIQ